MILNPIFFIITVIINFHPMQVNTCCIKNVPRFDSKFQIALTLDTGFIYPDHEESNILDIATIKKLLNIKKLPMEETIKNPIDLIYCDLICGNMYVILNYLEFFKNLNDNDLIESITGRMLASLFKINKTIYEKPFWHAYMYTLYSSMFQNETDENHKLFIEFAKNSTTQEIQRHIHMWCRVNNKYNEGTRMLNNIKLINDRQAKNDILLENKTENNWVSLKNIYLHQILEDKHFWRTIIITFGDQNEDVYKAIYDDMNNNYELANNYYYYDRWVMQMWKYLESIFNNIRIVTLHLIRNYLYYAENYRKSNSSFIRNVNVGYYTIKKLLLESNFFMQLFNQTYNDNVIEILEKLDEGQKISNNINETHIITVSKIDLIMKTLSSNFVLINSNTLFNKDYLERKKIVSLNDVYAIIVSYLRYLKIKVQTYSIAFSFMRAFKNYTGISFGKRTNSKKLIQL